jgi:chitinase
VTGFNAPLYAASGQGWSVSQAVEYYLSKGVPANKLVLGVPFYGYEFRKTQPVSNGLFQPYAGQAISRPYGDLEKEFFDMRGFVRLWYGESQVPYLWNGSSFVSYEDPQSIALKANYVKTQGLAGAMVWEISQDPSESLLKQVYRDLK